MKKRGLLAQDLGSTFSQMLYSEQKRVPCAHCSVQGRTYLANLHALMSFFFSPFFAVQKENQNNVNNKKGKFVTFNLRSFVGECRELCIHQGALMSSLLCESLGYQCTATDRETLINKLSVFLLCFFPLK